MVLNLIAIACALMAVGTAAAWVRSYSFADDRTWWTAIADRADGTSSNSGYRVGSCWGRVTVSVDRYTFPTSGREQYVRFGQSGRRSPHVYSSSYDFRHDASFLASARTWSSRDWDYFTDQGRDYWNVIGLRFQRHGISLPYWAVFVMLLLLPVIRFARWTRRRPAAGASLCPECDYDLRATPERCPECGYRRLAGGQP